MNRKLISVVVFAFIFINFVFASSVTYPQTKTYKLILDASDHEAYVRGGFCDYSRYLTPLPFEQGFTRIDGMTLTGKPENGNYVFSGKASIAVQINSLQDVQISLKGGLFSTNPDSQSIKITNNDNVSRVSTISGNEIVCEIPDGDKVLVSEYMLMEVEVVYKEDALTSSRDALSEVLGDKITLRLEYSIV